MALTFLGTGFEPFIERYLLDLNPLVLYWINMISAVLDNATLAAAEISPAMDDTTIKAILLRITNQWRNVNSREYPEYYRGR